MIDFRNLLRLTSLYKVTFRDIGKLEYNYLKSNLMRIKEVIPFYKNLSIDSIEYLDILRKDDIVGREDLFKNKNIYKFLLLKTSTGGTSGKSLNLYRSIVDVIKETAFVDYAFKLIDNDLRICVIRGTIPKKGIYQLKYNKLILSSYELKESNIKEYIYLLKKYKINCIHAYPSSILIFLRYVKNLNLQHDLNNLKGIVTSSEILSMEDKKFIKSLIPNVRLIDIYGQNEHVAFAFSIDLEPYHFFKEYGFTEFIPVSKLINGNTVSEIVSTGYNNTGMSFVRYGTEDYVEIDNKGNILSIIGRSQDYLYDFNMQKLPSTISNQPSTLKNVISFQFYQNTCGNVDFRIEVNNSFCEHDVNAILADFKTTYGDRINVNIIVVDKLSRTKMGKLKRLIQKIEI